MTNQDVVSIDLKMDRRTIQHQQSPKSGSPANVPTSTASQFPQPSSLDWLLGVEVKVTTILDDVVTGTVFSYCTMTETMTLMKDAASGSKDLKSFRILKMSFIRSIAASKKAPSMSTTEEDDISSPVEGAKETGSSNNNSKQGPYSKAYPFIVPVQLQNVIQKENNAIKATNKQLAHRGVGVSAEAQEIFDALVRTLPCRWDAQKIVVMDEIRIEPPYTADSCRGPANAALARVKKVLEGERKRLNIGERKGG